jgi:hypothetical protein
MSSSTLETIMLMCTRPVGVGEGGRGACCLQDRAHAGGKVGEGQARCRRVESGIIENGLIDFPKDQHIYTVKKINNTHTWSYAAHAHTCASLCIPHSSHYKLVTAPFITHAHTHVVKALTT